MDAQCCVCNGEPESQERENQWRRAQHVWPNPEAHTCTNPHTNTHRGTEEWNNITQNTNIHDICIPILPLEIYRRAVDYSAWFTHKLKWRSCQSRNLDARDKLSRSLSIHKKCWSIWVTRMVFRLLLGHRVAELFCTASSMFISNTGVT